MTLWISVRTLHAYKSSRLGSPPLYCPVCVRIPELFVRVPTAVQYSTKCCVTSHDTSTSLLGIFQASNIGKWYTTNFHAVCCSGTSFTVKSTSTLLLVFHFYMLQCIYLQCESARKHVRGYPLGTCTAFSSFECKACVQSLQRQCTFRLFCMWNRLSLSSSLDSFAIREYQKARGQTKRNGSEPIIY